jgi:hypothetical protein
MCLVVNLSFVCLIVTVLTTVTKTIFRGEKAIASHSEYAVCDWNDNAKWLGA